MMKNNKLLAGLLVFSALFLGACTKEAPPPPEPVKTAEPAKPAEQPDPGREYLRDVYSPLHFQPAIATAKDEDCLTCHKEILDDKVREKSPAGLTAANAKAWYQELSTYTGDQQTFHQRHLTTPYAKKVMNLKCNTCHQGQDPRDEAPGTSATAAKFDTHDFTLRKQVNPEATCLKCHGQMPWEIMTGLTGPWPTQKETFANNCLSCHVAFRTVRHQVNYLHPEAIEDEGQKSSDSCYGCHGGRAWYRISYPYPRHKWEGMPEETPEWAKNRPTESEARFLTDMPKAAANTAPAASAAPAAAK